jgi:hypothetical protein
MNNEEIQALMEKLKSLGLTEEDIANGVLWPGFKAGKISKEDLDALLSALGLEMDPDFKDDDGPGEGAPAAAQGEGAPVSKEEAEDLKEIKPGESKEEFQEKVEEAKGGEGAPAAGAGEGEKPAEGGEEKPAEGNNDDEEKEWDDVKKNVFKL